MQNHAWEDAIRTAAAIACTLAALLLASAASADLVLPETRKKAPAARTLRVAHLWDAAEARALGTLARRFSSGEGGDPAPPRVTLEALPRTPAGRERLARLLESGAVDLVIADQLDLGPWVAAGLLAPLDAEAAAQAADMPAWTRQPLALAGHAWGLPLSVDCAVLFFNRKLVRRPPRTTDELLEVARAQTQPEVARAGLAIEADLRALAPFVHGLGGALTEGALPRLDTPPAAQALGLLRGLLVAQGLPVLPHEEVARRFNQGLLAMAIGGVTLGHEVFAIEAGVGALPLVSATGKAAQPLLFIDAVMIAARGEQAAARSFARYLVSPYAAQARARDARQVIPSEAVLSDPWLGADLWTRGLRAAAAGAAPASSAGGFAEAEEAARPGLEAALSGRTPPQEALAQAQRAARLAASPRGAPVRPEGLAGVLLLALLAAGALRSWALRRG